jgi:hypothetical protein
VTDGGGGAGELIAAAGHVDDVAGAVAAVAERLADHREVDAEIALLDESVRPHGPDQVVLTDQCPPCLDQCDQEVERPAPQPDRPVTLDEQLPCRIEPERSEGKSDIGGGRRFVRQGMGLDARGESASSYMRVLVTVKQHASEAREE